MLKRLSIPKLKNLIVNIFIFLNNTYRRVYLSKLQVSEEKNQVIQLFTLCILSNYGVRRQNYKKSLLANYNCLCLS